MFNICKKLKYIKNNNFEYRNRAVKPLNLGHHFNHSNKMSFEITKIFLLRTHSIYKTSNFNLIISFTFLYLNYIDFTLFVFNISKIGNNIKRTFGSRNHAVKPLNLGHHFNHSNKMSFEITKIFLL